MVPMVGGRVIEILLVEPDATEARRTTSILSRSKVGNHVTVASDPTQAMSHLRTGAKRFASAHTNLILLSVDGLPGGGEELLRAIKCDPALGHIPVIVLGGSASQEQAVRAYDLEANSYVPKPLNENEVERMLETTREFWLGIVKLPFE